MKDFVCVSYKTSSFETKLDKFYHYDILYKVIQNELIKPRGNIKGEVLFRTKSIING